MNKNHLSYSIILTDYNEYEWNVIKVKFNDKHFPRCVEYLIRDNYNHTVILLSTQNESKQKQ